MISTQTSAIIYSWGEPKANVFLIAPYVTSTYSLVPKHYIHTYYNIFLWVEFGKFASLGSRHRKGLHPLIVAFKCIYKHFPGRSWA